MSHGSWRFLTEQERYHGNCQIQMHLKERMYTTEEWLLTISRHSRVPFILHIVGYGYILIPKAFFIFDQGMIGVGLLPL